MMGERRNKGGTPGYPSAALNKIPELQKSNGLLERQIAAQLLYRRAEILFYTVFVISVVFPLCFAISGLLLTQGSSGGMGSTVQIWAAVYGVIAWALDEFVLDPKQVALKRMAAVAQEEFDTTLFALPWNADRVGARLPPVEVYRLADLWRRREQSNKSVMTWYAPEVGQVPLVMGRVICQRINIWWDSTLRRRYATLLILCVVLLAAMVIIGAVVKGLQVATCALILFALLPAFRWLVREAKRQRSAASLLDALHNRVSKLLARIMAHAISDEEAALDSRQLQDDIFEHRRTGPIGMRFIYQPLRAANELWMRSDAAEWVAAYHSGGTVIP